MNLTRRFFSQKGVTGYRIVESLGATEGTPAAGLAELIVDITTTGATLKANGLRVLDDGLILKSQANLIASKAAPGRRPCSAWPSPSPPSWLRRVFPTLIESARASPPPMPKACLRHDEGGGQSAAA